MLKAFKTEIAPAPNQTNKIHRTIGVCRFVYNFYLAHNTESYEKDQRFVRGMDFSKWLNTEFISHHSEYAWIKAVSSKAVKQAIVQGEKAFKRFFQGQAKFPRFKKKKKQDVTAYFPNNNPGDWMVERHRIKIPTLGWVKLKEFGYIPVGAMITGGTISQKADRYFVSVTVEMPEVTRQSPTFSEGKGVDVGLKDFVIVSNGDVYKNLNKSSAIHKLEKKLKREQRALARKLENKQNRGEKPATKGGRNLDKNVLRVQKLYQRLANMRNAYRAYIVSMLVKTKPAYITIGDLNVKGMMKNRHLSRTIANQGFYDFTLKLTKVCRKLGIELREVSRFYSASKLCSRCGHKKYTLSLSERVYVCESCGLVIDRELNASLNLMQAKKYVVLT